MRLWLLSLLFMASVALGQDAEYSQFESPDSVLFVKVLSQPGDSFEARAFWGLTIARLGSYPVVEAVVYNDFAVCTVWQYMGQQSGSLIFRVSRQFNSIDDMSLTTRNLINNAKIGSRKTMGSVFTSTCIYSLTWKPEETLLFYVPIGANYAEFTSRYLFGSIEIVVYGMDLFVKLVPEE